MVRQKDTIHDFTVYDYKRDKISRSQQIVQKFTSYHMDERLDLFVFLELVTSLHAFDRGRLA